MTMDNVVKPASWFDIPVEQAIAQIGEGKNPTLDGEFTELANNLSKEIGYTALTRTPEYTRIQRQTLASILDEKDIKVFSLIGVQEYKDKKFEEMNKLYFDPSNFILGTFEFIFYALAWLSLIIGIIFLFNSINGWYLLVISIICFIIGSIIKDKRQTLFAQEDLELDEKWIWVSRKLGHGIDQFNQVIPEPILKNLTVIHSAAKESGLPIQFIVETIEKERDQRGIADPFISVRIDRDSTRFYFGVWDEPDFKGSYCIPS